MKTKKLFYLLLFLVSASFSAVGQNQENHLKGTLWINEIEKNTCYDSLQFATDSTANYYSCETDFNYNVTYKKNGDNIEILILDNHLTTDLKPVSKWILILKDSELEYSYIGQKFLKGFQEVDQAIYQQVGKFRKSEK